MSQLPKPWEVKADPVEDAVLIPEEPYQPEEEVVVPDAIMLTEDTFITLGDGTEMEGTSVVNNSEQTRRERYLRLLEMEQKIRDRPHIMKMKSFVVEYTKDFVAARAIARICPDSTPQQCNSLGQKYLGYGYVQLLLSLYLDEINEDAIVTRKDVLAGLLREANDMEGSQSARVAAWKAIGKILGMEIDRSIAMNVGVNVPAPLNEDDRQAFLEKLHAEF